jgi:hypothetical protein
MVHVASSARRSKTPPVPAAQASKARRMAALFSCSTCGEVSVIVSLLTW